MGGSSPTAALFCCQASAGPNYGVARYYRAVSLPGRIRICNRDDPNTRRSQYLVFPDTHHRIARGIWNAKNPRFEKKV